MYGAKAKRTTQFGNNKTKSGKSVKNKTKSGKSVKAKNIWFTLVLFNYAWILTYFIY